MPGGRIAEFAGSKRVFGWTMGGVCDHGDHGDRGGDHVVDTEDESCSGFVSESLKPRGRGAFGNVLFLFANTGCPACSSNAIDSSTCRSLDGDCSPVGPGDYCFVFFHVKKG